MPAAKPASPAPPPGPGAGRFSDANVGLLTFLLAMLLLGAVLGAIYVNRQSQSSANGPSAHHTLDSPYAALPFHRGAAQAQSGLAAGHSPARDLSFAYLTHGYEWFALTDLNTPTPPTQYETAGLVTVAGQQVQYPFATFLAYGLDRYLGATTDQQVIDWIHADAGVAFLAAPRVPPATDFKTIRALHGLDGIQIYNARVARDQPSLADSTVLWDQLLTSGDRLWGLVGDDTLDSLGPRSTLGQTSVDVQVPTLTPVLVEAALKKGGFVDSTGVRVLGVSDDNGVITVVTTDATQIKFIGAGGEVLQVSHGSRGDYRVRWNEVYIRAEATRASDGAKAWTQPIFVNP
jgi:hypothetical protein